MINIKKFFDGFINITKNPTLDAMYFFINKYHNLDQKLKIIHIAGTNGKGSCVEILNNILITQGYSVGKFMSPHLINYNERININHKNISNKELSDLIIKISPDINFYNQNHERKVTLFEIETTLALIYFYQKKVDFVILETGLGGLNDSTNVIKKPLISIITSIGFDHTNILGKSLSQIAQQKAGIIKKNSRTVFFSQGAKINQVFLNKAHEQENKLSLIKNSMIKNYSFNLEYQSFDYKNYNNMQINLKGKNQIKSACLCLESINILKHMGYKIYKKNIKKALKNIIHKARFETLNKSPLIIFDGAHNKPAIKNLMQTINMYYEKIFDRNYIICILARKDYASMLKILLEEKNNFKANFIFIEFVGENQDFFVPAEKLYNLASLIKKPEQNIYIKKTFAHAIKPLFNLNNNPKQINFITGSFYIYSNTIKQILSQQKKQAN